MCNIVWEGVKIHDPVCPIRRLIQDPTNWNNRGEITGSNKEGVLALRKEWSANFAHLSREIIRLNLAEFRVDTSPISYMFGYFVLTKEGVKFTKERADKVRTFVSASDGNILVQEALKQYNNMMGIEDPAVILITDWKRLCKELNLLTSSRGKGFQL